MAAERIYERVVVDPPANANLGPLRARSTDQVAEMARLRRGGGSMDDIARIYGVSKRTVYRYLAAGDVVEYSVEIGGWAASFEIRGGARPWRISPWRRT